VTENDYGLLSLNGAVTDTSGSIQGRTKKDIHSSTAREYPLTIKNIGRQPGTGRRYGDEVIDDTSARHIEVDGVIRVPERVDL